MDFYSESMDLPHNVFILLRDLIHERAGLYYEDARREILAEKLSPLVIERGFSSFLDYYYLLKYDQDEPEWSRVMDSLSVQETYFWREIDQVQALVDEIVPEHFRNPAHSFLRIWCAASATGEEPLSIAMALNEAGWLNRANIEIHASDASRTAVERAKAGLYRERSFRSLPAHLKEKYFTGETPSLWRIDPKIHKRIQWRQANIMDPSEVMHLASAPVIFCRNVFIYFSENAVRKAVRLFHDRMPSPGYLFVGVSESLFKLASYFELQEIGGAFVYVKR